MIEPSSRPVLRPLPRWVIVVGIPLMVVVAAGAVWVLLGTGAGGDQLDAIRTGSALGVGLGGIVVLWLAARRQRSTELDLLQKYEAHQLAERVAAAGERDATARRITDLYAKAVDQLGSEKAPVRLGGLYALERLAQDNIDPQLRQTVVNMICAYLRMPSLAEEPHEREVRLTAQRILENHLKPGRDPDAPVKAFWAYIDLDLTGATLARVDLSGCLLRTAQFTGTNFTGSVTFAEGTIIGEAAFDDAKFFADACFDEARFAMPAEFNDTMFSGKASFLGTVFDSDLGFGDATFGGEVDFLKARFGGMAGFKGSQFGGHAGFSLSTFGSTAWFNGSKFTEQADFHAARFDGDAEFTNTGFIGQASFGKAAFATGFWFEKTEFTSDSDFGASARVDAAPGRRLLPDGWQPAENPLPLKDQPGLWVSLVRVQPD